MYRSIRINVRLSGVLRVECGLGLDTIVALIVKEHKAFTLRDWNETPFLL